MFKFITLLMAGLFLWSGHAAAITTCPAKSAGKVNIIWSSDAVKYNFTRSQSQMDSMETDTKNPYDRSIKTHVGGMMKGGISLKSSVLVSTMTYPRSKVTCQWVDKMDVTIAIDPTIYIARQHKKGACKHQGIMGHEMKHVYVDREIVKRYAPVIKKYLENAVFKVGIVGPKPARDAHKFQKKITDYMEKQLKIVSDKMYADRRIKQQSVDNLKEYERVAGLCR